MEKINNFGSVWCLPWENQQQKTVSRKPASSFFGGGIGPCIFVESTNPADRHPPTEEAEGTVGDVLSH